jgi:hypothetical protein
MAENAGKGDEHIDTSQLDKRVGERGREGGQRYLAGYKNLSRSLG